MQLKLTENASKWTIEKVFLYYTRDFDAQCGTQV